MRRRGLTPMLTIFAAPELAAAGCVPLRTQRRLRPSCVPTEYQDLPIVISFDRGARAAYPLRTCRRSGNGGRAGLRRLRCFVIELRTP
jgi:hypothetical protein